MAYKFNPTTGKLDIVADPAGSDTQIQFNDSGAFGGDADLTYNKTTNALTIGGDVNLNDGGSFTTTLQTITPTANRTLSLPDATGTVALVAGSSGQLLYNSSGANAGASTLTYDGSILTTSGRFINSYNATASSPAKAWTGTWFTGGTATTTKPQVLIEPTGTTSTAWSTNGTGLGVNAASGFTGRLLDLQLNGTSNFNVSSTGAATGASLSVTSSTVPANGVYLPAANEVGFATNTTYRARIDASGRLLVGTSSSSNIATAVFQGNTSGLSNAAAFWLQRGQAPASITANANIGFISFAANGGEAYADISGITDGTSGASDYPGRLVFSTTADGAASSTERLRITNEGVIGYNQPAPAAVDTTATLTIANLKTGIITSTTAAAVTMTLPTGTLTEGGFSGLYNNFTFEWTVINTGATNAVTVQGGTDHTLVGSGTVAAGVSGRFASRRTAANTFVTYRIS